MKIVEEIKLEDCFDGSSVFRLKFDSVIEQAFVMGFRDLGKLDYFKDFPRPFFKVSMDNRIILKGVEGEDNCQVIYPRHGKEEARSELFKHITEVI